MRQAEESYADFLSLGIRLVQSSKIAQKALNLAAQERHSAYDTLYVVLAQESGCELITADESLVKRLGGKHLSIRWIGDF